MHHSLALVYASMVGTTLAYPGPAPTQPGNVDLAITGRSPIPTALAGPSDPEHLFRRQADRTCGYIDADYENAATCGSDYYCAYNAPNQVFGCCSGSLSDCYIQTACYPSVAAALSCDLSCLSNPYNSICTDDFSTFCQVYISIDGGTSLYNYGCGIEDVTSYVYGDYTNGPSSAPSIQIQVITSVQTMFPSTLSLAPSAPASSSTPSTPSSTAPIPIPQSKGKTPIGAIVGGVVGGLAVIAIAIIATILLIRKKRSTPSPPAPPVAQNVQPDGQPYMQQPMQQPMQPFTTPASPMSPPMSPAPPYGMASDYQKQEYQYMATPLPKGVAEAP